MNPETRLVWHPLKEKLDALKRECLKAKRPPPHYDRVENLAGGGTPDLSWSWDHCGEGWLELKFVAEPPKSPDTPLRVESVTKDQRLWWRKRAESGGTVYVLTRVGPQFILHEGSHAARVLGQLPLSELLTQAVWVGRRLEAEELLMSMSK